MKKFVRALPLMVLAFMSTTALPAVAETIPGFYADLGVGLSLSDDTTAKVATGHTTADFNSGVSYHGGGGYAWANGFRLEGDLFRQMSSLNKMSGSAHNGGNLSSTDLFVNGLYDINIGMPFTPYIGVGAGVGFNHATTLGTLSNGGYLNGSDTEAVYDGIVGAAVQFDANWAATADYRYVDSPNDRFNTSVGGHGKIDNASHNLIVGLRYSFGAPAAAMAATKTTAVPDVVLTKGGGVIDDGHYVVFFDFAKHGLTADAKKVVDAAAADYKAGHVVKIVVTGNTDTVGTQAKNLILSVKRAEAVKAELVKQGVSKKAIETKGVGESHLLVKTKDGVKEVQNRRAEILFESK